MSIYGFKLYSTFLYGPSPSNISSVSPNRGPSIGGQSIILEGSGFDPRTWDDTFEGLTLDATKWTDISSGTGSVTTNSPHLQLSTGTTSSSISGIESISSWTDCQLEIKFTLPNVQIPLSIIRPISFQLRIDANNYAEMYISLDNTGAYTFNCEVYRGGSLIGSYNESCSSGLFNFRILRWDRTVYFIYNGIIKYYNSSFVNTAAVYRIYANNLLANYDAISNVEWFYWRTYITIDNQLIYDPTVVSDFRIRGFTPPSVNDKDVSAAYAGLSDVSVVGTGKYTAVNSYEYYYEDRLRIMNVPQFDLLLSVIDDDQLITKSTSEKGL